MVYNYTKPRGPIAAMYGSPGPCYALPGMTGHTQHDPRSVHTKNPSYSFGIKHGKLTDDASPGPCYLPTSKVYRNGADGTPHYSLYSKSKELSMFKVPGPGAYTPESAGPQSHYHHPKYSFGIRHRHKTTDSTPSPNAYTLDTMTGKTVRANKKQSPMYTMRPKFAVGAFYEDLAKTPGPGTYNTTRPDTFKFKSPMYSMTSRNNMPGDSSQKPGPGQHSPERVYINKRAAPNFSFGIRHSNYIAPLIIDPVN
jgi:hypothetical protein